MKRRVRLTEENLHRIIESSVKQVINEIGDRWEKEYNAAHPDAPVAPGAGKFHLARKARRKAFDQGRFDQAENFGKYAQEAFNDNWAIPEHDFRAGEYGNPNVAGKNIGSHTYLDTYGTDPEKRDREFFDRHFGSQRALPRKKYRDAMMALDASDQEILGK